MEQTYNNKLVAALIGRRLRPDEMPRCHALGPMFSFWGEDAGMEKGDIHFSRAYRVYVNYDETLCITGAHIVVDGELLSPCSGYAQEALDEFDYPAVLDWCLLHTLPPETSDMEFATSPRPVPEGRTPNRSPALAGSVWKGGATE